MARPVRLGGRLARLALGAVLALGLTAAIAPAALAADPTASMSITKTASTSNPEPGVPFTYTIDFQCTAGSVNGCVNAELTDTLPPGLSIVGVPTLTGAATGMVTVDGSTVNVDFTDDLGVNGTGLAASGAPSTLTVTVVLDDDYPYSDQQPPLTNTAAITADNADPKNASADVVPDVELSLNAGTTKVLDPNGPDLPVPGTPVEASLTGTSTSNAPVDTLVISDPVDPTASPNPFDYLDVASIGAVTMPAGAETVQVIALTDEGQVDGIPGPPPVSLPDGVEGTGVIGLQFVFTSTTPPGIDPGAPAGVELNLVQAPEIVDAPLPLTITNTADTTVSLEDDSATSGPASDTYDVVPADIAVAAGKTFDPATVHAGDPSTVTVTGTNTSPTLSLDTLTVSDDPLPDGLTFTGLGSDGAGAGIVWPTGATEASVLYSCAGIPGAEQSTGTVDTLPAPPDDCDPVTGFTVTFTGTIAAGAQATIPFGVVTDPNQTDEELTRTNEVNVAGTLDELPPVSHRATAPIVSIVDRLAIETGKTIVSPQNPLPSLPGQGVIVELTGHIRPFPESTVDAQVIIVQEPDPLDDGEWFDAFQPEGVVSTPIPTDATLTVQYWDGTQWVDVPGMVAVTSPNPFSGTFPPDVQENAQGIRFVYTSTLPEPDGFAPGTTVSPNLGFTLRDGMANSDLTINDCSTSSAAAGGTSANSDPACADIPLTPPDGSGVNPIDKNWDDASVPERSQKQAGATLSWSTAGYVGLGDVVVTDTQDPATTALPASVFDTFDLFRIDPITPALDPRLTFDQITGVELYRLPAGSTDPAAGSWQPATSDPCPAGCDGTFPGYTLTGDERATTIGFRLTYIESPTRASRISGPTDPPVGTGVAVSSGNNRRIHPVFQLRDELRSDPDIPVTADRTYNAGQAGLVRNTVRVTGTFTDPVQVVTRTDSDTILITDIPVTAHADKSWDGGPLGIPEAGVPADEYPTGRVTLTGQNTRAAKVDQLLITDPVTGTPNPFDAFNLVGFASITDPAAIGATDVTVTLDRGGASTTYTRDEALAQSESELADVTGMVVNYTGRIDSNASAQVVFDSRLRPESRSTGQPPAPGTTFSDTVGVSVTDLADYPGVDPDTATDAATDTIDVVAQGLGVTAGKSFSPDTQTEPDNGPVTVTLTGQPSGPSRTVRMMLEDTSPTFWNQYDLIALNQVGFTAPIDRVQVDAFTGGAWSVVGGVPVLTGGDWVNGTATAGPDLILPGTVTPAQVQGLRFTFTRADGSNWENPANPSQPISFSVERRTNLQTGGPVPSDLVGNSPAPGETTAGVATDGTTATVTSSDVDGNGVPLTESDDATAAILYHHATNAVSVQKGPSGVDLPPGSPFTYTLTVTNSGDVPITNPVITDQLPVDGDGPQLTYPDDGANYQYTLSPAGSADVPMPTDPTQVTVTESPIRILFEFPEGSTLEVGQTYTIKFQMEIRPGLPAGTVFTNTFGVTGDRPWDECAGTLDPTTGQCQASAADTVTAAGVVSVRKKVKAQGSDVLGVELDPSAAARECDADPDGFYSRPCVPIAEPGGDVTWRWEFVNIGNLSIDRLLGIDRLPEPGDQTATAPLDRGSQWQPLLAGTRPTMAAPGTLNVYYTTATDGWCDGPQAADGALLCPALDWQDWPEDQALPVDPATVTGLQVEILPIDEPLPPAGTIDVDVAMVAPPFSPADTPNTDAASPDATIAFNSVGSAGRYVSATGTGYTLTTEPPRVGVGLAHGPIRVVKTVEGDAADQYAPDTFPVTLSCTSAGQDVPLGDVATLTLTPGEPLTVYDLPVYAECSLGEGDNGQTSATPVPAIVPPEGTADVPVATLTNVYEFASLSVTKAVDSDAVDQDGEPIPFGPFTVRVDCTYLDEPVYADGYGPLRPMAAELSDGDTVTFEGLPAGATCTVTETDDKGATTTITTATTGGTPGDDGVIVLDPDTADDNNTALVTNAYGVGSLDLLKVVDGEAADTYGAGPFTLHVTCVLDDETGERTVWDDDVVLTAEAPGNEDTIDTIATGAECTVTETDDGGASTVTVTPDQPVVVGDGQTVTVTATNTFDPGALLLTKLITGDASAFAPTTFPVKVTCTADGEVLPGFPDTVDVTAGENTQVPTLVGASCTAVETDDGSATEVTYDPAAPGGETGSGAVIVGPDLLDPVEIGITNEYRAGGLRIVKELDGPGASIGPGPFVFTVTCSFNGVPDAYTDTVTLSRDDDATILTSPVIGPLPVGAVCDVVETDTGGADVAPPPVTVTIPDVDEEGIAQVAVAGFVNEFSAATVQVTKVLAGDDQASAVGVVFTVAVTCQVQSSDGEPVDVYTGSVQVTGGQTVPVTDADGNPVLLQLGAHCFATETDSGGADSSSVDFDSYDSAVIVESADETGTLTITAINTFDAPPVPPAPPVYPPTPWPGGGGGSLSSTGFPATQWVLLGAALLALGAMVVSTTRRRRTG